MQKSIFRAAIEALESAEKEAALLEEAEQQRANIIDSAYAEAAVLELTGTVPLSNGNIVAGSDDGSTLIINNTTVYSSPGSQGFGLLNYPWTGGDGTFSFELVYGKSGFGPPAQLEIELPETPVATPLPAALPLFATGLGGLGLLGWRRKRKAQAV
jgi:hypothetical protein